MTKWSSEEIHLLPILSEDCHGTFIRKGVSLINEKKDLFGSGKTQNYLCVRYDVTSVKPNNIVNK